MEIVIFQHLSNKINAPLGIQLRLLKIFKTKYQDTFFYHFTFKIIRSKFIPQNFTSMTILKTLRSFMSHVSQDEEHHQLTWISGNGERFNCVILLSLFHLWPYQTYKKANWGTGFHPQSREQTILEKSYLVQIKEEYV